MQPQYHRVLSPLDNGFAIDHLSIPTNDDAKERKTIINKSQSTFSHFINALTFS